MAKEPILKKPPQEKAANETSPDDGYFVVELERPLYDQFDGQKMSKPFVQKFSPGDFALQITPDASGKPLMCVLGHRVNKIISVPDESYFTGVRVRQHDGKFVPLSEALKNLEKYLEQKPKKND